MCIASCTLLAMQQNASFVGLVSFCVKPAASIPCI